MTDDTREILKRVNQTGSNLEAGRILGQQANPAMMLNLLALGWWGVAAEVEVATQEVQEGLEILARLPPETATALLEKEMDEDLEGMTLEEAATLVLTAIQTLEE